MKKIKFPYRFPYYQSHAVRQWVYRIVEYLIEMNKPEKVILT